MEPPGADPAAGAAASLVLGVEAAGAAAPNRELAVLAAGAVELAGAAAPEVGVAEPNSEVADLAGSAVAVLVAGLPPKSEVLEVGAAVVVVAGAAEAPPAPAKRVEVPLEVVGVPALACPNTEGLAGAASVEAAGVLLCVGAAGLLNKLEPEVSAGLEPNMLGEEAAGLLAFANRDAPEVAGCVVAVF